MQPDARFVLRRSTLGLLLRCPTQDPTPNANVGKNHQCVRKMTKDMKRWGGEKMNQSRKEGMKNRKKPSWVNDNGGVE